MAVTYKLSFVLPPRMIGGAQPPNIELKGTPTEILTAWNARTGWNDLDSQAFRATLVRHSGADDPDFCSNPIGTPEEDSSGKLGVAESDEDVLEAVVDAYGPDVVKLQRLTGIGDAVRRAISGA